MNRQKKLGETIKETSKCMRLVRVKKWPKSFSARWWWWWWWWEKEYSDLKFYNAFQKNISSDQPVKYNIYFTVLYSLSVYIKTTKFWFYSRQKQEKFSSPKCLGHLLVPPSLLFNVYI